MEEYEVDVPQAAQMNERFRPSDEGGERFRPSDDADYVRPPSSPPKLEKVVGNAWDQQANENALWYQRFIDYLKLGPTRSVSLAATGRRNAYPLPSHWMVVSRDYRWKERATAWDAAGSPTPAAPRDIARRTVKAKPRDAKKGIALVLHEDDTPKVTRVNKRTRPEPTNEGPVEAGLPTEDGAEASVAPVGGSDADELVVLDEVTAGALVEDE